MTSMARASPSRSPCRRSSPSILPAGPARRSSKIRQNAYAAVVLDILMPEMDGIKAFEELRRIDPDVAVIMLTGYGTLLTAQQAMVAGANQYLRSRPTWRSSWMRCGSKPRPRPCAAIMRASIRRPSR